MIPVKDKINVYANEETGTTKKAKIKLRLKRLLSFKTNEKLGSLLGLLILIVISLSLSPHFFTVNNLFTILRQNAVLGLVVLGMMTVILGGCVDFSVGSNLALCGIVAGYMKDYDFWVILITVCAVGCLVGFINGYLIAKKHVENFITTLGMMILIRGICLWVTHSSYIHNVHSFSWLASGMVGIIPLPVILLVVFYIIFHILFTRTVLGKNIYAIGGNEVAARLSGVKTENTKITAFVICGLMCAFAALINVSRLSTAESLAGTGMEIDAIAASLVGGASLSGGRGSIGGAFIGLAIFAVLYNIMNLIGMQSAAQQVAKGAIIIIAVLLRVQVSQKKSK